MTIKKKILWSAVVLLLLAMGIIIGGSFYLIDFALRPENRGKNMVESETFMRKEYPQIVQWLDSLEEHHALRDTFILAPDGIRMHAFYAHASRPTAHTAIIVHGYTDNAIRMFHIGYLYNHSLDYNILLPDLRYAGLTEGDAIQMGWLDRKDVRQWTDVAPALFGDSLQAVVHGISMGAATTMMASGVCSLFCRGLRIYQRMGTVQQRTERFVRLASFPITQHGQLDLPVAERMEFSGSFGFVAGSEMPQAHAVHPRRQRRLCTDVDGIQTL